MIELERLISSTVEEVLREKLDDLLNEYSTGDLQLFTTKEGASILKVDTQVFRRLCREGLIDSYKVGGHYRVTKKNIGDYLERRNSGY